MSRQAWVILLLVQVVGEVCSWTGPHISSAPGPLLWLSGSFLLLPGRLVSVAITEKLLWGPLGLSLTQMSIAEVVLELPVNLLVWLACAKLLGAARGHSSSPSYPDPSRS